MSIDPATVVAGAPLAGLAALAVARATRWLWRRALNRKEIP